MLLDVACGAGDYTLRFLSQYPELKAVGLDLPHTLTEVKRMISRSREETTKRMTLLPCNYQKHAFGSRQYDVALLSHVISQEGPDMVKTIFEKTAQALKPDGLLILKDQIVNETHSQPSDCVIFCCPTIVFWCRASVLAERVKDLVRRIWLYRTSGIALPSLHIHRRYCYRHGPTKNLENAGEPS